LLLLRRLLRDDRRVGVEPVEGIGRRSGGHDDILTFGWPIRLILLWR
jgi:hypothetical protein